MAVQEPGAPMTLALAYFERQASMLEETHQDVQRLLSLLAPAPQAGATPSAQQWFRDFTRE